MYINHEEAVKQYLINVEEDKEEVVSKNSSVCYINYDIFNNETINNIDDFLNVIEKNISTKNIAIINQYNPISGFEYGNIKADIAV